MPTFKLERYVAYFIYVLFTAALSEGTVLYPLLYVGLAVDVMSRVSFVAFLMLADDESLDRELS